MKIKNTLKVVLLGILFLNLLSSLFLAIINPEAFLFGYKLGGAWASAYLLANGCLGIVAAYALYRWEEKGSYLSFIFFGYNFVEVLITNIYAFGTYAAPPLHSIGLIIAMVLIIVSNDRVS